MTLQINEPTDSGNEPELLLVVEIFFGGECPASHMDDDLLAIRQHATAEAKLCEFITEDTERRSSPKVHRVRRSHEAECFCSVFAEFECVPHFKRVTNDSVLVETFLPHKGEVWRLLNDLEAVTAGVQLKRLTATDVDRNLKETCEVDFSELTTKQRRALEAAVAEGYFESPKETSLEVLADEFDISPSAFSQRLTAGERRLLHQLFSKRAG